MIQELEYKLFHKNARKPYRAFKEDAGADLVCPEETTIKPGEIVPINLGIGFNIPNGTCLKVYNRSSMAKKGITLQIGVGIIDSGYTGSIHAPMINHTEKDVIIEECERIVQVVLEPVYITDFKEVENLSISERGSGKFGSTGKK